MATSAQAMKEAVQGLWRRRANDPTRLPGALRAARVIEQGATGEYQFLSTDLRRDLRSPLSSTTIVSEYETFPISSISYSKADVAPKRHLAPMYVIPDSVRSGLEDANSALDLAVDAETSIANHLLAQHLTEFVTNAKAGLANPAAGTLDLSTPATDLATYFRSVITEIILSSTERPNYVYMGRAAADRMITNDTIQNGTSLAVGASPTVERRTGYVADAALVAFFASLGLELIVEDMSQIATSGSAAFLLSTDMFVGRMDDRSGTIQTFSRRNIGRRAGATAVQNMVNIYTQDLVLPNPAGIGVAGDGFWEIAVTNPNSGREITVSL
jgi:hypothetical protein